MNTSFDLDIAVRMLLLSIDKPLTQTSEYWTGFVSEIHKKI